MSGGSCAPIENSPPGSHTMPSGTGPGAGSVLVTVGLNVVAVVGATVALGESRPTQNATAAAMTMGITHSHRGALPGRDGTNPRLDRWRRFVFMVGAGAYLMSTRTLSIRPVKRLSCWRYAGLTLVPSSTPTSAASSAENMLAL